MNCCWPPNDTAISRYRQCRRWKFIKIRVKRKTVSRLDAPTVYNMTYINVCPPSILFFGVTFSNENRLRAAADAFLASRWTRQLFIVYLLVVVLFKTICKNWICLDWLFRLIIYLYHQFRVVLIGLFSICVIDSSKSMENDIRLLSSLWSVESC